MQICQVLWIWHGYMIDTCVLLSPRKNCFPIFLPRSWDICALSCTCLPELYIHAPQYVARPFNETDTTKCHCCGYLVFCVMLPCLGVQHRGTSLRTPFNTFSQGQFELFFYQISMKKKNFVVLQLVSITQKEM